MMNIGVTRTTRKQQLEFDNIPVDHYFRMEQFGHCRNDSLICCTIMSVSYFVIFRKLTDGADIVAKNSDSVIRFATMDVESLNILRTERHKKLHGNICANEDLNIVK